MGPDKRQFRKGIGAREADGDRVEVLIPWHSAREKRNAVIVGGSFNVHGRAKQEPRCFQRHPRLPQVDWFAPSVVTIWGGARLTPDPRQRK